MAGKSLGSGARGPKPANQGSNTKAPTQKPKTSGKPHPGKTASIPDQSKRKGMARPGIGGPSGNRSGNSVPGH